ncbi:MAG: hypothetical protein ACRESK_08540, partial [Gammaproteobacteria bacterium]
RLHAAYAAGDVRSRPVLVPLLIPVAEDEAELLEQHQPLLAQLGLEIRQGAPGAMMVRELPQALSQADAVSLVRDIIDALKQASVENDLAAGLMALFSRHANDCPPATLTLQEMQLLLAELHALRDRITGESFNAAWRRFGRQELQNLLDRKR